MTAGILQAQEGIQIFDSMVKNLEALKKVVDGAKKQYADRAAEFGRACREGFIFSWKRKLLLAGLCILQLLYDGNAVD